MTTDTVPKGISKTIELGGVRRLPERGPCLFLDVDRPLRCTFELTGQAGASSVTSDPESTEKEKRRRGWKSKLRFPGPRLEPMQEKPADPRRFRLTVTPESRKKTGKPIEMVMDKPGKEKKAGDDPADPAATSTDG